MNLKLLMLVALGAATIATAAPRYSVEDDFILVAPDYIVSFNNSVYLHSLITGRKFQIQTNFKFTKDNLFRAPREQSIGIDLNDVTIYYQVKPTGLMIMTKYNTALDKKSILRFLSFTVTNEHGHLAGLSLDGFLNLHLDPYCFVDGKREAIEIYEDNGIHHMTFPECTTNLYHISEVRIHKHQFLPLVFAFSIVTVIIAIKSTRTRKSKL
jgi:hypothetical protein